LFIECGGSKCRKRTIHKKKRRVYGLETASPEPSIAQPRQRRVLCPCGDGATEVLRMKEKAQLTSLVIRQRPFNSFEGRSSKKRASR